MNITVYLASSTGNDHKFEAAVKELGTWIGASGNTLVYGGSKTGLMGELAQSVLQAGGKVIGVEPQFFIDEDCFAIFEVFSVGPGNVFADAL